MVYLYIVTDKVVSTVRFETVAEALEYIDNLQIPQWFISNSQEVVSISTRSPK